MGIKGGGGRDDPGDRSGGWQSNKSDMFFPHHGAPRLSLHCFRFVIFLTHTSTVVTSSKQEEVVISLQVMLQNCFGRRMASSAESRVIFTVGFVSAQKSLIAGALEPWTALAFRDGMARSVKACVRKETAQARLGLLEAPS